MHHSHENEFTARLEWVVADRKITPWAKKLGLSSGTAARLLSNVVPGTDILTAIMRTEHVNLNWLLEGKGSPFMLDSYTDAAEFENMLRVHAQDAPYDAYINMNERSHTTAVILVQPASYEFKGKKIDYNHIETLLGPYDNPQVISAALTGCNIKPFEMSALNASAFGRGQFGTYKLLGDHNHKGLVNNCSTNVINVDISNFFNKVENDSTTGFFTFSMDDKLEVLNKIIDFAEQYDLADKLDKKTKLEVVETLEEMHKPVSQITPTELEFAIRASVH
ncbi:hypothetical protein KUL42_09990 [Alteromonas sp. KUL42]|uniref:hypothetical protein n=1 Tax=Alteromonas sp. KUL42 TaxID=2480797 RepID=UPI001036E3A5|nr:hypothetical protein [Alteromonas sp. KUL42]TAP37788.1 hypothetical protein EYR97_04965 [Alteromonas sp. KUL42]GEA06238.1 hypothetical protein KUL42_09990 [Alteromonas sp. KUL42]